ncbi:MAG: tRNA 2-thiouridine(34) synthase MnmA [Oscillospiraceae bacterium]|nr:tRNA 2-thiouridine(34) synthase MnmA [Oscillospiraceae bacterium]
MNEHNGELALKNRVVLGLSGGVDSAVAARLLQQRGLVVFGIYLDIGSDASRRDAEAVAANLGISLRIADVAAELEEKVCRPFVDAYLRGETPNPCILCNPNVKFKVMLEYADSIGAYYVSTGHYAKTVNGHLYKGRPDNDQSYMLSGLRKEQVGRLVLPLGDFSKNEVRQLASDFGLPVADKPASMEICFIPDKDYGAYIERRGTIPPEGDFVDESGRVLGRHKGIHRYTVGQRRGLNIAAGKRIFVSEIRPETNEVVLSEGGELFSETIKVRDMNWLVPQTESFEALVRVRHSRVSEPAEVIPDGKGAEVRFIKPVRAPTKGQTAAFYVGDEVVGGGFIV